jgi:hypothetical protein
MSSMPEQHLGEFPPIDCTRAIAVGELKRNVQI